MRALGRGSILRGRPSRRPGVGGPLAMVRGPSATPSPHDDHDECAAAYCSVTWQRRIGLLQRLLEADTIAQATARLFPQDGHQARAIARSLAWRWLAAHARVLRDFPFATSAEFDLIIKRLLVVSHEVIDSAPRAVVLSQPAQLEWPVLLERSASDASINDVARSLLDEALRFQPCSYGRGMPL